MNISDHISKSLETIFRVQILKFFDADPGLKKNAGFGMEQIQIRDPLHCSYVSFISKN
jgi:hypothetical protein